MRNRIGLIDFDGKIVNLALMKISAYYKSTDARLKHFARWVNSRIYKVCPDFDKYEPWMKDRSGYFAGGQLNLFAA